MCLNGRGSLGHSTGFEEFLSLPVCGCVLREVQYVSVVVDELVLVELFEVETVMFILCSSGACKHCGWV